MAAQVRLSPRVTSEVTAELSHDVEIRAMVLGAKLFTNNTEAASNRMLNVEGRVAFGLAMPRFLINALAIRHDEH
jgi:hypothetical protein